MPENHFDGWVAKGYDAASTDMYAPEVLDPTVDLLADLAGDGAALELAIGTGASRTSLRTSSRAGASSSSSPCPTCSGCSPASATSRSTSRRSTSASTRSTSRPRPSARTTTTCATAGSVGFETPQRYVWQSELDLMARIAGMTLVDRFGDWDRRPFTGRGKHISVRQKPA